MFISQRLNESKLSTYLILKKRRLSQELLFSLKFSDTLQSVLKRKSRNFFFLRESKSIVLSHCEKIRELDLRNASLCIQVGLWHVNSGFSISTTSSI